MRVSCVKAEKWKDSVGDDEDVEKIFLEENFYRGKILSGVSNRYKFGRFRRLINLELIIFLITI